MSAASARAAASRPRAPTRLNRDRAADEARRAFLRMVSHELRTPLNAIIGFSDLLAQQAHGPLGAPEYVEYADIVRRSGRDLLTLVNQTLELARLEAGSVELSPEAEALGPALAKAAEEVREAFPTAVAVEPVEAELQVRADAGALGTMLGVLLRQAAAASPTGGEVRVGARAAGARVVVEVRDQGPGCARRDLPSLLRPFAPGSDQLAGRCAGSGLELPIARLLAKASGGSLTLRSSQAAGGMTAVLSLPRA